MSSPCHPHALTSKQWVVSFHHASQTGITKSGNAMSIMVFVGVLTEMATKFQELGRKGNQTVKNWVRRTANAGHTKKFSCKVSRTIFIHEFELQFSICRDLNRVKNSLPFLAIPCLCQVLYSSQSFKY